MSETKTFTFDLLLYGFQQVKNAKVTGFRPFDSRVFCNDSAWQTAREAATLLESLTILTLTKAEIRRDSIVYKIIEQRPSAVLFDITNTKAAIRETLIYYPKVRTLMRNTHTLDGGGAPFRPELISDALRLLQNH